MDPVTVSVDEAKKVIGIGHTKIYELIANKRIDARKLGRRTLITTESIRAFVNELEAA